MKKYLISIFLFGLAACNNSATTEIPKSSLWVETKYEDRTYELGESITMQMDVTESYASGNYFDLEMNCDGAIEGTIEGEPIVWGETRSFFYEIANATSSTKRLYLTLTPQAGLSAEQNLNFTARFMAADGSVTEECIPLKSVNSAKITVAAICTSPRPLKADEQHAIVLLTHKENYNGSLDVTSEIIRGQGFFILDTGNILHSGATFSIPTNNEFKLYYQPLATGNHEINFRITDHITTETSTLSLQIEN